MKTIRTTSLAALAAAGIAVSASPGVASAATGVPVRLIAEEEVAKVGAPSINFETLHIGEEECFQAAHGTLMSNDRVTDMLVFTSANEQKCSLRVISGSVKAITISDGGELVEHDTRVVELHGRCVYKLSTLRTKVSFPANLVSVTVNGVAKLATSRSPKTCTTQTVPAYTFIDLTDVEHASPAYEAELG